MVDVAGSEPNERHFVDLHARSRRIGGLAWVERRLFETLGAWTGTTDHPPAARQFGGASRRHGWHAELLRDRLPELASVDAEELISAPGPATAALMDALAADRSALGRLVALYRVVLPALVVVYREELATTSPVAEPSLERWLAIVARDDVEEWCDGVALLDAALQDAETEAVRDAAEQQLELDLLTRATAGLRR